MPLWLALTQVTVGDVGVLSTNFGFTDGRPPEQGDFTGDRFVNVVDVGILATNFGIVLGVPDLPVVVRAFRSASVGPDGALDRAERNVLRRNREALLAAIGQAAPPPPIR